MSLFYLVYDNSDFLNDTLSRGQIIGRDFAIFWSASVLLWRGEIAARCFVPNGVERGFFAVAWLLPLFTFSPSLPMGAFVLTVVFVILLRQVVLVSRQKTAMP